MKMKWILALVVGIVVILPIIQLGQMKPAMFSNRINIKYTECSMAYSKTIMVSEDGSYQVTFNNYIRKKEETFLGKLSEEDMADLVQMVINKERFFYLPKNVSSSRKICDAPTEHLTVIYENEKHECGGYDVMDSSFKNVVRKLNELKSKCIVQEKCEE